MIGAETSTKEGPRLSDDQSSGHLPCCSLDSLFVAFSMARWDIGGRGKESQQPGDTKSCIERQRGP